ncbi:MAG: adenylyl-sulfate kinase, partial [Nitrososphaerota archaeon]|nr:adenylyl-sulfate kinase [Nitrososphaerota archaeon]
RETRRKNNNLVRKQLYLSALRRLQTGKKNHGLGKVPGVDEPFQTSRKAEIILDSTVEKPRVIAETAK